MELAKNFLQNQTIIFHAIFPEISTVKNAIELNDMNDLSNLSGYYAVKYAPRITQADDDARRL